MTDQEFALAFRDVSFRYAGGTACMLKAVSFSVPRGAFALLSGVTGAGKSTLLSLVKPELMAPGEQTGSIRVFGRDVRSFSARESVEEIGFVTQTPQSQIVCDEVWSELAFGLENLGMPPDQMQRRVAEIVTYLGMESWFHSRTSELSAGRCQLLVLASALALHPQLLLLDEPAAQLDRVSARKLVSLIVRANRELGLTVVVATHSPELFAPYASCVFALEGGSVVPSELVAPTMGVAAARRDKGRAASVSRSGEASPQQCPPACVTLHDVWFRHTYRDEWVLRGLDLEVAQGEVHAVLGANGSGKTTLLRLIARTLRPVRGRVQNVAADRQAYLPAQPQALLTCESLRDELLAWAPQGGYTLEEAIDFATSLGLHCDEELLSRHPHDLSGGQMQLFALAKLLLVHPRVLLLDEPTKGLDETSCRSVARVVGRAAAAGCTIVVATHDSAFVELAADRISLLFDGRMALSEPADVYLREAWL